MHFKVRWRRPLKRNESKNNQIKNKTLRKRNRSRARKSKKKKYKEKKVRATKNREKSRGKRKTHENITKTHTNEKSFIKWEGLWVVGGDPLSHILSASMQNQKNTKANTKR